MSALAQWLNPAAPISAEQIQKHFTAEQLEKFRRYHWRQYFLAVRRKDQASANQHRTIAAELEAKEPAEASARSRLRVVINKQRTPSTLLINREHTRRFLLEYAKDKRSHRFNRVSEETLRLANEMLRQWCISHVNRFPSKGQTL